jgi:hypothetical protein
MNPRFKNMVTVKGSKQELEAFAKELEKAGYVHDESLQFMPGDTFLNTYPGFRDYGYLDMANATPYILPEQQEQALLAATETI